MFKNDSISFIYRLLCLLTFIFVIIFVESYITLIMLGIFFFILTFKNYSLKDVSLSLLSFFVLLLGYFFNNYLFLRLILIVDYVFYYLDVSMLNNRNKKEERKVKESKIGENAYYRFNNKKKLLQSKITSMETLYLVVHFIILLFSIMVG